MKKKTKKILTILIILLFIIGIFFSIYFSLKGYKIQDIKNFLPNNLFIVSIIFLIIFSLRIFIFIPSTVIIIVFGFLTNNFLLTFLISILGIIIGLTQTYYIGYLLEEDLENSKIIKKISPEIKKIKKDGFKYIFIGSLAPFFPTDLICYASGFIKYNYKKFLLAGILGEIPLIFLYSLLGVEVQKYIFEMSIFFIIFLGFYLIYIYFLKAKK